MNLDRRFHKGINVTDITLITANRETVVQGLNIHVCLTHPGRGISTT